MGVVHTEKNISPSYNFQNSKNVSRGLSRRSLGMLHVDGSLRLIENVE